MAEKQKITQEGYNKLNEELEYLIKVRRPQIQEDIAVARAQGDLSENAEYHAAKEMQGEIEDRIRELNKSLQNIEILSRSEVSNGEVSIGSKIVLFDKDLEEEVTYYLVSSVEADLDCNKISDDSLLGKALKGKKTGEDVEVHAPAGTFVYTIISVD